MAGNPQRSELTQQLKQYAGDLGFALVGITPAAAPGRLAQFQRWLDSGFAGQMSYLENRRQAYAHPCYLLEGCKTLVMLGIPYLYSDEQRRAAIQSAGSAKVARYAQSRTDYHVIIRKRLKQLKQWLVRRATGARIRGVVDTAPLLEREFAALAGLGWIGKNTLLLNRNWGSYFFLAALLTDIELVADEESYANYCGSCTACLDACPTGAFPAPYVLDARRCLSYLTIEHPGTVDGQLSSQLNGWAFGCDICQEVCPWNRKSACTDDNTWQPVEQNSQLSVLEMLRMHPDQFQQQFAETPMSRPRYRGMVRNAILVAGQQRLIEAAQLLGVKLCDEEPLIRAAAAWALGQIGGVRAASWLQQALDRESDLQLKPIIQQSLVRCGASN
ncbi:MAG: tRNA epoxyqueuosine(34) reductase QueG [Pirellulaceae bacterium]|nr:tRNA epoxyqueuosine(34) reductase QueG [Pirellulaceae bacterium]